MQDTDPTPFHSQAERLAGWLRLHQTPGVGRLSAVALVQRFGSPQAVFAAGFEVLRQHVSPARARALSAAPAAAVAASVDATLAWLSRPGNVLLTFDDPAYPALLRQIPDPPLLLYAVGRTELLGMPCVAIVGSRNATAQGVANAGAFAQALSSAGLTVVSGLALGIDAAAHQGGLRGPGATVAVIGTGADRIYPRRNEALTRRIAAEGCIVSEYPLGTPPLGDNFPRRNRLISGLSCAVLVIEAAAGSGSLITARVAAEQGRDVFAIPGSIHAPLAKGCHQLIKAGAKLVESIADLLDDLQVAPLARLNIAPAQSYQGDYGALLSALGQGPIDYDTLAGLTEAHLGTLATQLLSLELAGHVERLPGGFFQRVNR